MERDWIRFIHLHGNIEGARAEFESACRTLLRKMYPNQNVRRVKANPGDEGIDILVGEIGEKPICIFQCKFIEAVEETQKGNIRSSFKSVIDCRKTGKYEVSQWILCVPITLDADEQRWWSAWKKRQEEKHHIPIDLWDGDDLIDLMKEHSVYNQIFQFEEALKTVQTHENTEEIKKDVKALLQASSHHDNSLTIHAQQVKDWLIVLGYTFEPETIREGTHIGWIARKGFERVFVLILCDVIELPHVTLLRQYVEQYEGSEGWLITTLRISPPARQEIKKEGTQQLRCYTFDELLDRDVDFTTYLEWLESQIKETAVDQQYVPLAFQKREFNPHTRTYEPYTYNEEHGWLEGYLDQWSDDAAKRHISILGEFGMGKTWSALHYAWRQLQRYQEAKQNGRTRPRLPLYIPLREYPIKTVESLFDTFFSRYQIHLYEYVAFEQLNKMGKLLLIFDGFDEISNIVNSQVMSRNFWELARAATDHSKIILTCRNEYFPNAKDARALLNAELRESTAHLSGESPQFEILELVPFTEQQIRQALTRHASPETIEKIVYDRDLMDLARRPVLIELIIEALPEIEAGKLVDLARIYLYAISRKLQRDINEGRTMLSLFEKVYFLCELSCAMLYHHPVSLNYTIIRELIMQLFSKKFINEQVHIDSWTHDMLVQTVLVRDEEGNYAPAHRSFLDFFVAYKAAIELGLLASDCIELLIPFFPDFLETQKNTSNDIGIDVIASVFTGFAKFIYASKKERYSDLDPLTSFMMKPDQTLDVMPRPTLWIIHPRLHSTVLELLYLMMLPLHEHVIQALVSTFLEAMKGKSGREVMYTASNIVVLLLKHQPDFFKGKDVSHLHLPGLYYWLPGGKLADFTDTSFQGSELTDADFSRAILTHANLCDTILDNVSFRTGDVFISLPHPQNNLLIVESRSHVLLVDIETNAIMKKVQAGQIGRSRLSPDQQCIVTVSGKTLTFVELESFSVVSEYTINTIGDEGIDSFAFGDTPEVVICGGDNLSIYIWNIRENTLLQKFELEHEQWSDFNYVSISSNKQYVLASTPNTFQIWNIVSEKLVFIRTYPDNGFLDDAVFHPQDNYLVVCKAKADVIEILSISDSSSVRSLQAEPDYKRIYFNDEGSLLAVVYSKKIVLYDYDSGQIISECHIQPIEDVLYHYSENSLNAEFRRSHSDRLEFSVYNAVVFNRNRKFIHITADPGYVLTYEIQTGTLRNVFAYMEYIEGADFTGSKGLKYELAQQLKGNGAIIDPEDYK